MTTITSTGSSYAPYACSVYQSRSPALAGMMARRIHGITVTTARNHHSSVEERALMKRYTWLCTSQKGRMHDTNQQCAWRTFSVTEGNHACVRVRDVMVSCHVPRVNGSSRSYDRMAASAKRELQYKGTTPCARLRKNVQELPVLSGSLLARREYDRMNPDRSMYQGTHVKPQPLVAQSSMSPLAATCPTTMWTLAKKRAKFRAGSTRGSLTPVGFESAVAFLGDKGVVICTASSSGGGGAAFSTALCSSEPSSACFRSAATGFTSSSAAFHSFWPVAYPSVSAMPSMPPSFLAALNSA